MNWFVVLVAMIVLFNLLASVAVVRNFTCSALQRFFQLLAIWFVPVLGAVVCLAFTATQFREASYVPNTLYPLYNPADGGWPETHNNFGEGDNGGDGGGH